MASPRTIVAAAAVLGATVLAVVALGGSGEDRYRVRLVLGNAAGLTEGSPVAIGGVAVGKVKLSFSRADKVVAELEIDRKHAPISRDTTAAISAVNLLGRKRIDLVTRPNSPDPAPDGFTINAARVTVSTDLDQVLNVLTPDTRTRLAILLNEAGMAFAGRKADVNGLLRTTPPSLAAATTLLNQVVSDNRTLGRVVERSDSFVGEVAARRRELTKLLDAGGQAAGTLASRREQLRTALARAPRTLATLQRFLGELDDTAAPLGGAARELTSTAPELSATLEQLEPFRQAARPVLDKAITAAPLLTRLATRATPVLRRATPTAASLATFATALDPVSTTLDSSSDNIIAILHNWSRAIQFRDGASHVFRGQPSITPETLMSAISRLTLPAQQNATKKRTRPATTLPTLPTTAPSNAPSATRDPIKPRLPLKLPEVKLPGLDVPKGPDGLGRLLDFLLAP